MYSEKTLERFKNPIYAGEIKDADAVGEVGNVKCGDIMKLYLKIENNIIKDIKFKTYGCIAAIASTDYLCEIALGKTLEQAKNITSKDVIERMGGDVPAIKVHCSVLAQDALKKAIEHYNNKNNQKQE